MAKKSLEAWIRECMSDTDKDGPLTALTLVHMQGTVEKPLHRCNLQPGSSSTPRAYADLLRGKAEAYAQDLSGVQTFQVLGFWNGSNEPQAFQPFVVTGALLDSSAGLMTEAPTKEGQTAQSMRHTEALMQAMMKERAVILDKSLQLVDAAMRFASTVGDRLTHTEQENIEALTALKEMVLSRDAASHKADLELAEYNRKTEVQKELVKMIPPLANQLTGKTIFPESTVDTAIVEAVAENVTPDQLAQIAGILNLPPQKIALLAGRLNQITQAKAQEEAAAAQRPNEVEQDAREVEPPPEGEVITP